MTSKNYLFIISLLLFTFGAFAQTELPSEVLEELPDSVRAKVESGELHFTIVEDPARPVGGMSEFYMYISKK